MMLHGDIEYRGKGFVLLAQGPIGYRITLPEDVAISATGEKTYYVHEVIRDDGHDFYGFDSVDALELFWKLVAVSGVGAKSAQKIIYTGSVDEVRASLMKGDLTFLTNISGIGKKTAQKIILELKGALAEEPTGGNFDQDALDALVGLGYTRRQVEEVLAMVDAETTEDRIKQVLKLIGGK